MGQRGDTSEAVKSAAAVKRASATCSRSQLPRRGRRIPGSRERLEKSRLIRGADFPGGMANAGLPFEVSDHSVEVARVDGGTDESGYDFQEIIAGFDDLQVGHRIRRAFEPL